MFFAWVSWRFLMPFWLNLSRYFFKKRLSSASFGGVSFSFCLFVSFFFGFWCFVFFEEVENSPVVGFFRCVWVFLVTNSCSFRVSWTLNSCSAPPRVTDWEMFCEFFVFNSFCVFIFWALVSCFLVIIFSLVILVGVVLSFVWWVGGLFLGFWKFKTFDFWLIFVFFWVCFK